ncbi:MAG: hypothetical protein LKE88_05130 [Acidaminococcus provencensis]|jgi:hypothetical protein|nr:hypothetical protein [Acidaminococcus provencensis]MCH4096009.1 hypothetical protein [Acidaminococcus provencensis]
MQTMMFSGRAVTAAVFFAALRPGNGGRKTGTEKRFVSADGNVTRIF